MIAKIVKIRSMYVMKESYFERIKKTGIVEFAKVLTQLNYELYSNGGTKRILHEANVPVRSVYLTHFPATTGWPC